ncbi:shikimate kinase AroL [Desulfofustis limnaeus]|uniref:shikimate kinase AroL n=1 Tax=Desulfofustis limnaeus TaxID=2740163 RepID=UPI0024E02DD4|nr:shikimate kinase AroL [Desulfofustis limnaeus]MDX9893827.1 shikimate kinase AroL [Desulfofustis sp.]
MRTYGGEPTGRRQPFSIDTIRLLGYRDVRLGRMNLNYGVNEMNCNQTKPSIVLVGARAVGKTTIGRKLAESLGFAFCDTDELIRERAGCAIADLVAEQGWPAFRALEREVLVGCVERESTVVATGGGAVLHLDVWPQIKRRMLVFWLTAPLAVVRARLEADPHSASLRPSLTGEDVVQEYERVLRQREPLYRDVADRIIDCDALDSDRIVSDIMKILVFS